MSLSGSSPTSGSARSCAWPAAGLPLLEAPRAELDRITGGAIHQGVALQVPPYTYAHPDDLLARAFDSGQVPLLAALDGVTDPRNLGAVIRSVAAFGGQGVSSPSVVLPA